MASHTARPSRAPSTDRLRAVPHPARRHRRAAGGVARQRVEVGRPGRARRGRPPAPTRPWVQPPLDEDQPGRARATTPSARREGPQRGARRARRRRDDGGRRSARAAGRQRRSRPATAGAAGRRRGSADGPAAASTCSRASTCRGECGQEPRRPQVGVRAAPRPRPAGPVGRQVPGRGHRRAGAVQLMPAPSSSADARAPRSADSAVTLADDRAAPGARAGRRPQAGPATASATPGRRGHLGEGVRRHGQRP